MPSIKTFATGAAALALGCATFTLPAVADDHAWFNVKNMLLTDSQTPEIVVKNTANNHQLSNLNLTVQGNTIAVSVGGAVECTGITSENYKWRHGAYLSAGGFGIGRTSLLMSEDIPYSSNINRTGDLDAHTFQMPKNLLSNPQIGIDPAALILAEADKAPDRLKYLQQDHIIMATLPVRWESLCAEYSRNKIIKKTTIEANQPVSYLTKDIPLRIVYKGDPQLTNLNAQIANSPAMQGGFKAADQVPVITKMNFQPNLPHHTGACPANTKIRVFYQGHGKGAIQIRIAEGNNYIADSGTTAFDGTKGQKYFDFYIQVPKATASQINKTVNHTLKAVVRTRISGPSWDTPYKEMDVVVWKHRCTPQLNPSLGGGPVGGVNGGGYKQGGGAAKPSVVPILPLKKAAPSEPEAPVKRAQ